MARAGSGGVLSPGKAFFLLLIPVVAAGLLALFFVGRDSPGPSTNARPAEGFALTDSEAIAKFEELNALRLQALRERDPSLLSLAFTADSPAADKVSASIRKMTRSNVFVRPGEDTKVLSVISSDPSEISVRQVLLYNPTFVDEAGEDTTVNPLVERQTVEWTLRRVDTEWLIYDGVVVASEPLNQGKNRG